MKKSNSSYRWMLIGQTLGSFGNSITWTGLPILFAQLTGHSKDMGILFFSETVASLLLTLVGGHFADRWRKKPLCLACSGMEIGFLLAFYLVAQFVTVYSIAFLGLATAIIGAFGSSAMSVWFAQMASQNETSLEKGVGRRNSYMMVAKLMGMSLGPILYMRLGIHGLLIDAFFALLVLLCLAKVRPPNVEPRPAPIETWRSLFKVEISPTLASLLCLSFLGAATSFPLINAGLYTLREVWKAPDFMISSFWLTGAVGSLLGNLLMANGWSENLSRAKLFSLAAIMSSVGIALMSVSQGPWALIASFSLVTLSNPIMNNLYFSRTVVSAAPGEKGRILALSGTLSDAGTLLLLALFTTFSQSLLLPLGLMLLLLLVLSRIAFLKTAFAT